jgi:serine O-acetyltransferase
MNDRASAAPDLEGLAAALAGDEAAPVWNARRAPCAEPLPSRREVRALLEDLRAILFPGYHGDPEVTPETLKLAIGAGLDRVRRTLLTEVKRGICFACREDAGCGRDCDGEAEAAVGGFLSRLPALRRLAALDVRAAFEGDPAAPSADEVVFCYPGLVAVTYQRIAHELHVLGVPLIPRMITEEAHAVTGIDIHPGAAIGESFFIDHGTGVVVGETAVIGNRVRLYQGVTLGARSFPRDAEGRLVKGVPRHPVLEDDVIVYANATILGRVTIGRGSVIGGNVWLTRDLPPGSVVTQHAPEEAGFLAGAGI